MNATLLDTDGVWRVIDAHRLQVCAVLDELAEDEWRSASLCDGWTVRDVAAHLTLQQAGVRDALGMMLRHPGGMNGMIRKAARRRAAAPTAELAAAIRGMVGSRRTNVGVTCRETLIDILVHSQDIAVPLGRALPLPADGAAEAAGRVWAGGWPFHPRKHFAGFRFTATDVPWAAGDGREVTGPAEAILLVLTGRHAALPRLSGEGAAALTLAQ